MKHGLAITSALALILAVGAVGATAATKANRPFAGATKLELVLTKRDGSTATAVVERTRGERRPNGLFRGVVHADITVTYRDGSRRELDFDRGKVSALGGGSITLRQPRGRSVTVSLSATTRIRKRSGGEVAVGDRAMILSANGSALVVRAATPKPR